MKHEKMHAYARAAQSRALVRSHLYRQRHLAAGVWIKLRFVLAGAERALAIDEHDAAALEAEGLTALPDGLRIEPNLRIYVVTPERAAALRSARELVVRLDERLLRSGAVAIVEFASVR